MSVGAAAQESGEDVGFDFILKHAGAYVRESFDKSVARDGTGGIDEVDFFG